jgi:hypothetical protein
VNLCKGSSELPTIGDSDDSMFMGWDSDPVARLGGLVRAGRVLLGYDIPPLGAQGQTAAWLTGDERQILATEPLRSLAAQSNESGGWISLRHRGKVDIKVVFYAMPLGLPPLYGHGHAHALSIGLWLDGIPVVADPGTYTYAQEPWRAYFKGTRAHSTVEVEGKDQAASLDTFTWGSPYWCSGEILNPEEPFEAWGTHTGYLRLPQRVTHKRTVQLGMDKLRVEDVVNGQSSFSALLLWQIHPGWTVEMRGSQETFLRRGNYELRVVTDGPGSFVHRSGTTDPMMGWFSPRFDELVKGHTLAVQSTGSGITWVTEISARKTDRST